MLNGSFNSCDKSQDLEFLGRSCVEGVDIAVGGTGRQHLPRGIDADGEKRPFVKLFFVDDTRVGRSRKVDDGQMAGG